MKTPELKVAPNTSWGYAKYLLVVGYINTKGVTIIPNLMHSVGKLNSTPKLMPSRPPKKVPAYNEDNSPVVNGLALVLSTCLSMSRSAKSLIMQPALRAVSAPTVNKPTVHKLGIIVGELRASPQ
jgi:hypothetical protein